MKNAFLGTVVRALRSHRMLGRLHRSWVRGRALAALDRTGATQERVVIPFDFQGERPSAVSHGALFLRSELDPFEAVLVDTERLADVDPRMLERLRTTFGCVWRADPFAVFSRGNGDGSNSKDIAHAPLLKRMQALESTERRGFTPHRPKEPSLAKPGSKTAVLVTTFNRPSALARSLPLIGALGCPLLVVDDGSDAEAATANRALCQRHAARYLLLPENRGLPSAMNIGLDYWLADPEVEWISYLQDDVDVKPELLEVMRSLQDPTEAPLLTGFDAADHPTVATSQRGERIIRTKRTTPAVHLHGHRSYWASVMPIPSPYLGAPKPRVGASLEDWWITSHAPSSVEKRGLVIPCAPGLVTTFLTHRDDSTWDNPAGS